MEEEEEGVVEVEGLADTSSDGVDDLLGFAGGSPKVVIVGALLISVVRRTGGEACSEITLDAFLLRLDWGWGAMLIGERELSGFTCIFEMRN